MTLLQMAVSYRYSADLIRERVCALKSAASQMEDPAERTKLEQRVRELSVLYRETRETARVLENYYNRGGRVDGRKDRRSKTGADQAEQ